MYVSHSLPNTHFVCAQQIMMADDMGWGDTSYNGGTAHTPHLDEWSNADSAILFHRFYAAAPICSPTRASVFTG